MNKMSVQFNTTNYNFDDSDCDEFTNDNNNVNNVDNEFYNPANEFSTNIQEIHIHKQQRNGKKCTLTITGLKFDSKDSDKKFISDISKKLGISGHKKDDTFIFTGDKREQIKQLLIDNYNKNSEFIICHG